MISDCRKRIADNADIDEKNKKIIETYLNEYENFIEKPESWLASSEISDEIEPTRAARQYEVVQDKWVQHAARARYLLVEGDENILGNLQVNGNTILNNVTINGNFNPPSIGCPNSSCLPLLPICRNVDLQCALERLLAK